MMERLAKLHKSKQPDEKNPFKDWETEGDTGIERIDLSFKKYAHSIDHNAYPYYVTLKASIP